MKNKFKDVSIFIFACILSVASIASVAGAALFSNSDYSTNYVLPMKSTLWSGKSEGVFWSLQAEETKLMVTITSHNSAVVEGSLYQVLTLRPDRCIVSAMVNGADGATGESGWFIPEDDLYCYPRAFTHNAHPGISGQLYLS